MQFGNANVFAANFSDQCTYWASQRYHALTGLWTPCTGNAYQWSNQSANAGWNVNATPPKGLASILCLQPFTQGAGAYGHVAVVERVNSDGSVYTSGYDWYPHEGDSVTVYVTFKPGAGVSFLSAQQATMISGIVSAIKNVVPISNPLSGNASVATTLSKLDTICVLTNPFDINAVTDTFTISLPGGYNVATLGSMVDPVSWLSGFGTNIVSDTVAFIMRSCFMILGIYLLFRVIDHYLNITSTLQQAVGVAGKVASL